MQDLAGKIDRIKQIKYTDAKGQDKTIDGEKLKPIPRWRNCDEERSTN